MITIHLKKFPFCPFLPGQKKKISGFGFASDASGVQRSVCCISMFMAESHITSCCLTVHPLH